MSSRRIVCDNNLLISAMIFPKSLAAQHLKLLFSTAELLVSMATLHELRDVAARPKFAPYAELTERIAFVERYADSSTRIEVVHSVTDCRDPKDNKFLELALSGRADCVVTGDNDLLCLHPWRGIRILSSADYLAQIVGEDIVTRT